MRRWLLYWRQQNQQTHLSLNSSHADHLNTPRLVANQQGQTVWRWDQQEPFGITVPDENPSGLGAFEFALRFPGQYADKETNLHYNYYRDYDPSIGRYGESDPIGLRGGLNTYAYVGNNPISLIDPLGLQAIPMPPRFPPPGGSGGNGRRGSGSVWDDIGGGGGSVWDDIGGRGGAGSRGGGSDDDCMAKCQDEYWTNIAMCTVARAFWGAPGAARCYANAMEIRVECEKKCRQCK